MTLVYANVMWVYVCVTVSVYVVVVWQGPMEEQFLYWMDFTLYKYIWNKNKIIIAIYLYSNFRGCFGSLGWWLCFIIVPSIYLLTEI